MPPLLSYLYTIWVNIFMFLMWMSNIFGDWCLGLNFVSQLIDLAAWLRRWVNNCVFVIVVSELGCTQTRRVSHSRARSGADSGLKVLQYPVYPLHVVLWVTRSVTHFMTLSTPRKMCAVIVGELLACVRVLLAQTCFRLGICLVVFSTVCFHYILAKLLILICKLNWFVFRLQGCTFFT